jgi:hypothetical protein
VHVEGIFQDLLPKAEDFSRALYTFDIGQNDLTAGYFLNMSTHEVEAYVPDVLDQFKAVVKVNLINLICIYIYIGYNIYELTVICMYLLI